MTYAAERHGQFVVHTLIIDRKIPTANEWLNMHPMARIKPKKAANLAFEGMLARHLPKMGGSKAARERIRKIRLVRRSPRYADGHDAIGLAFKYVTDAFSGWYVDGPLYDRSAKVGQYDDKVIRSEVRPNNPVTIEYGQELARTMGFRVELWEHDPSWLDAIGEWLADVFIPRKAT